MKNKIICPKCNSGEVAVILWGYPVNENEVMELVNKGKLVLGGCCVSNDDPKWECNKCSYRWGRRG